MYVFLLIKDAKVLWLKLSACLNIYSTFTTERYIGTTISGPGLTY